MKIAFIRSKPIGFGRSIYYLAKPQPRETAAKGTDLGRSIYYLAKPLPRERTWEDLFFLLKLTVLEPF